MKLTHALALVATLAGLSAAHGQGPPPAPGRVPSPLLYVRFIGPAGMRVTFYQGSTAGHEFPAPVTVGLRPGYPHRVKLTGFPDNPTLALYPTLEVRGVLQLPPRLNPADYPAPVVIGFGELQLSQEPTLVTKVVYLENPEMAYATATKPNEPVEVDLRPTDDPLLEARLHGRPMVIVRLGGREVSVDELARSTVPGTVLLPGQAMLPPPACRPWLPWAGVSLYDPLIGSKFPDEECLHDGGDVGPRAGYGPDGQLHGVDPSDAVAEYTDAKGRRQITPSNRICLCVPRFAAFRTEMPLVFHEAVVELGNANGVHAQTQAKVGVPSRLTQQNEQLVAVKGREKPSANITKQGLDRIVHLEVLQGFHVSLGVAEALGTEVVRQLTEVERLRLVKQMELAKALSQPSGVEEFDHVIGTAVTGKIEGLELIRAEWQTREFTIDCKETPHLPEKPLCLFKWADAQAAQIGDLVTFHLKYSNLGGKPITNVAVSDSLTGRLEYVPGTARADRNAVFTTKANEAGSLVLHWEITGQLLPGESGVVTFQAKVR
jgi:uncharacterized repeat protein (TIGR01451 family)